MRRTRAISRKHKEILFDSYVSIAGVSHDHFCVLKAYYGEDPGVKENKTK